jgi:hypothetical protein
MSTPVPQDIFSRVMTAAYDEKKIIGCSTGFLAFFGNPANGSETIYSPDANVVDIDIIRGNERIAALIPRGTVSQSLGSLQKNLRSEQFTSFSRKYPLAEEESDITADNLLNRVAGENPYTRTTRMDRMRHHASKLYHENIRRLIRMDELLATQSILTGKQDAIIGTTNTDLQYDFRRISTNILNTSYSWTGGSAVIMTDIDTCCAKVRATGKMMPDMCVMGSTAINAFVADTTVKALADNRRFDFMQIGMNNPLPPKFQRFVDGGMIPQGKLRTPAGYELYLFTYLEIYTAENGTATKYLADDKMLICSSQARCDRYFGPPEMLPNIPSRDQLYREYFGFDPSVPPMPPNIKAGAGIIMPQSFYTDAYASPDGKRITIRVQHAPIFVTTQTDAFVVMDVVP